MEGSDLIKNNKVLIDKLEKELVQKTARYLKSTVTARDLIIEEKLAEIADCDGKDCVLDYSKIWFAHKIASMLECSGECGTLYTFLMEQTSKPG